jgi:uncharacterized membrane protein
LRIRIPNWIIIIDILTVLLAFDAALVPSRAAGFILGLPLLLFFPGYALLEALFVNNKEMGILEQLGISCGMSVAIVGLISFGLNYTEAGISLMSAVLSVAVFVIVASAVALARQARSGGGIRWLFELEMQGAFWRGSARKRRQVVLVIAAVVVAIGALGYAVKEIPGRESFTEFYILGQKGQAGDYPEEFIMAGGQVIHVKYGRGVETDGRWGEVTVGIVNQEGRTADYRVKVEVDGQPVAIMVNGAVLDEVDDPGLLAGGKWEGKIGFAPQHVGDHQKVEFILFQGDQTTPKASASLWISVTQSTQ